MQAISELEACHSELEIYHAGELTVLGFGGREILHDINLANDRDEIANLVRRNHCRALAFDLTGVYSVPSGLVGILSCLIRQGLELHLYNPSLEIREILTFSKIDQSLHLHEIEI